MSTHDDLMDWWEELREQGVSISPEQLCSDHPELLEGVRREIQALHAFDSRFGVEAIGPEPERSRHPRNYDPPDKLQIASRYKLVHCHASGGLGQVFIATDEILGRRVAIKFPKRQGMTDEQIQRFNQEAQITGQLDHPSIVPIYALDSVKTGEPCYVMRFVEGRTLHEEVNQAISQCSSAAGPMYWNSESFRKLLQSLIAVCNAVAFAHGHGVIHRDIKPNNILLGPFGETLLLDWGLAKRVAHNDQCDQSAANSSEASFVPG